MSQKSPKFFLREKVIAQIVNYENLRKTWKEKTHTDFRNFFLPDPIDYLDVNIQIDDICKRIVSKIKSGEYSVSGTKRYLVEKSKGLCRQMTLPSVEDALTLQCLADAFWNEIKSKGPSKNAFFEPKDHTFSKTSDDIPEYGSIKAWLDFQKEIPGFSKENNFIVIADIANYYDFIDFSHLRNVIVSTVTIREPVIDFLMYMLSGMCWKPDYMPTRDVGMPQIDIDAPRLLAHCFLFELDAVVEDMKFANYARFMDDIDAGVDNIAEAKKIIKSIDLTLQTRQLRLNAGKTRILTYREARKHFKVLENAILELFQKKYLEKDLQLAAQRLPSLVLKWHKRRSFDDGNGEKILKRAITFAIKCGAKLDREFIYDIIRLRPNIRTSAFRYLSHDGFTVEDLVRINGIIKGGHVCDDSFVMEYAKAVCVGKVVGGAEFKQMALKTIDLFGTEEFYSLYAVLILCYRFSTAENILEFLKKHEESWRHDDHLGRVVGGFAPIARRDNAYTEFSSVILKSMNRGAKSVQDFHYRVRTDVGFLSPIIGKFSSLDKSFPCGIRLGKWLVLHSILQNDGLPESKKAKIKSVFKGLKEQPHFAVAGL
ncbi:RNA-directed DNA polymerase [Mesorhizobium sp. VK22B]|uniref:RNA-directed DNA polymerase n=1 Tax=Mesorhizobium captivum TaxID=3072319 RepID=A0ABU4Z437_9HYPH|nr:MULTISPECIES: RNA-directed DNA polymerase [unclassified Mesorhizobium]MDX8494008.1 RNA-directed DNA polymerase [Mesorhizobium sp. VK22B]MDX8504940.1 RNA-directed DNA polymerase [Mesorhizobium sp. VK22E]